MSRTSKTKSSRISVKLYTYYYSKKNCFSKKKSTLKYFVSVTVSVLKLMYKIVYIILRLELFMTTILFLTLKKIINSIYIIYLIIWGLRYEISYIYIVLKRCLNKILTKSFIKYPINYG